MTRASHRLRFVAAALALLLGSGLLASGWDAGQSPAAPAPGEAAVVIDPQSRGGRCDDARTAADAALSTTPWCTIERAIGDEGVAMVVLRGGDYPSVAVAERARPTTIRAFADEVVRIDALAIEGVSPVRVSGIEVSGNLSVAAGARNVTIVGSRIGGGVALAEGSSDIRIVRNDIQSAIGTGVFFSSGNDEPPIERVTIARNRIHHTGVSGINARNFRDVLIDRNEIDHVFRSKPDQHTDAIRTFHGGSGLTIRRNYLHDNFAIGIFTKDGPIQNLVLENNIVVRTRGHFGIQLYDVDGVLMIHNTVVDNSGGVLLRRGVRNLRMYNNILDSLNDDGTVSYAYEDYNYIARGNRGGLGSRDLRRGLRFANRAGGDYHPAAGSTGIDAGRVRGAPARDQAGRARLRGKRSSRGKPPDLGALEYRPRRPFR